MLGDYFFVHGFFVGVLNDVLHPEQSLLVIGGVFDVFVEERFDHMLCCLIPVFFEEVIDHELVQIEKMSVSDRCYY